MEKYHFIVIKKYIKCIDDIYYINNLLYKYIVRGYLDVVKYIFLKVDNNIKKELNLNYCVKIACKYDHINIIKFLIKMEQKLKNEVFYFACKYNKINIINELLPLGFNISYKKYYAIKKAFSMGNINILQLFLKHNIKIPNTYINNIYIKCCQKGHLDIIKYIDLNYNNIINIEKSIEIIFNYGHIELIKYFIKKHKDIFKCNINLYLNIIYKKGYIDIFKYINSIREINDEKDNLEINKLILPHLEEGFYTSCLYGNINIVKYIDTLKHNVDINYNTAIKKANLSNNIELIKFLLYKGANIEFININYKKIIYKEKIVNFYRRQKFRKRLLSIQRQLIPIYYHPDMKGGYFAKKELLKLVEELL